MTDPTPDMIGCTKDRYELPAKSVSGMTAPLKPWTPDMLKIDMDWSADVGVMRAAHKLAGATGTWAGTYAVRVMRDGIGAPLTEEEQTAFDAMEAAQNALISAAGEAAAQAVRAALEADARRLEYVEDWLDGFEFVERGDIQRHWRCDWFAGDGGGHWFTEGTTFRKAIDKSLNHEAVPAVSHEKPI